MPVPYALQAHGAVPVLFASQWFLSAFSCPFPVSFACRLVDVMLMENSDAVLMRTALAVMAECEAELLMQETFEELLTYLKVEPMNWGPLKLRRVLNATVNSPVTDAELELAAKEASEQDHLLLTNVRREKGRSRGREAAEDGGGSGTVTAHDEEQPLEGGAGGEASGEVVPVSAGGVEDEGMAAVGEGNEDIESELAQHQAELDTAYLQMILDLDQMGFEDSEGTATEAYEQALTGREDGSGGLVERQPGEARE